MNPHFITTRQGLKMRYPDFMSHQRTVIGE